MIYVWFKYMKIMQVFRSEQGYWESGTYDHLLKYGRDGFEVMCEYNTPLWKEEEC